LNIYPWLPSLEINDLLADSLNLYIGTPQGLTVFAMKDLFEPKFSQNPLPLVITSVKINKQDTTIQNEYRLSYDQNTIDIGFAAINFQSIKDIRFQYRMITPLSKDSFWHDVSDFHKEFAYLEEGSYRFYLRATNMNENMSTLSEQLVFHIAAPFWRRGWFVFLIIFFILSGIWLYSHHRVNKIKTEEAAKTAIHKQFADLELRALQAQMNPHFIFNALTAVQSFVLNKDTHSANEYLTKFSMLMRQSLEASRRKFIPLSDEIDMLKNYIALEQVRFKDKFEFACVVGVQVDILKYPRCCFNLLSKTLLITVFCTKMGLDIWH
jgi:hypothetical protein